MAPTVIGPDAVTAAITETGSPMGESKLPIPTERRVSNWRRAECPDRSFPNWGNFRGDAERMAGSTARRARRKCVHNCGRAECPDLAKVIRRESRGRAVACPALAVVQLRDWPATRRAGDLRRCSLRSEAVVAS